MNIKKLSIGLSLVSTCIFASINAQAKSISTIDSIGVEYKEGKEIIIHRLIAKESYYSLSRLYQVSPKDISTLNANKRLKAGDLVKVPTNRNFPSATNKTISTPKVEPEFTEYKVGRGETLYNIAKRFQVSVESITDYNKLQETSIKPDQLLKIPQGAHPLPIEDKPIFIEAEPERELSLPANRYGLTQVTNRGLGVWMEDLNTDDGKMLALHNTAPVGTIIKITNPMSQRTTYAKVVGKYNDSNDTRDAIIVISKATASLIGVIDKRFLVNISYGIPN